MADIHELDDEEALDEELDEELVAELVGFDVELDELLAEHPN